METDQHQRDELVRRLASVDDADLEGVFDARSADMFAREIMGQPGHTELDTAVARTGAQRWRFAPALAAAAIIVFAAVTFTFLPFGTSQSAIAGWGPEPSPPTPALLAAARAGCPPPLEAEPGEQLFSFMASDPPIAAVDLRGNAASAVFADDTQYYACTLVELDGTWEFSYGAHGIRSSDPGPIDAGSEHLWVYGEMGITTVVGDIDGTVERVTIQLEDGAELEATVGDGMFVAWWPSTVPFDTASAYDGDGVEVGTDDSVVTSGFMTEF